MDLHLCFLQAENWTHCKMVMAFSELHDVISPWIFSYAIYYMGLELYNKWSVLRITYDLAFTAACKNILLQEARCEKGKAIPPLHRGGSCGMHFPLSVVSRRPFPYHWSLFTMHLLIWMFLGRLALHTWEHILSECLVLMWCNCMNLHPVDPGEAYC